MEQAEFIEHTYEGLETFNADINLNLRGEILEKHLEQHIVNHWQRTLKIFVEILDLWIFRTGLDVLTVEYDILPLPIKL